MAVSSKRNYHHDDIMYHNKNLINAQSNMFFNTLNQFDNNHNRKYNSVDGIFDIPKIKLFDRDNVGSNTAKVKQGNQDIRHAVSRFLHSKIVNQCCAGAFANFEYTVYRKPLPSKFKKGQMYMPKYALFHPHVHITLIVKKHRAHAVNVDSLKARNVYAAKTPLSKYLTNRLSDGDYILMNREWNKQVKTPYNHFYLKDTYIKSHDKRKHVRAYWSLGWNKKSHVHSPFCKARPVSRKITSQDSAYLVKGVTNDIAKESNKYRGLFSAFYKGVKNHNIKSTMNNAVVNIVNMAYNKKLYYYKRYHYAPMNDYTSKKIANNLTHSVIRDGYDIKRNMNALKATYYGYHLNKNKYPRHFYTGVLHDYAQKHIFNQFPKETLADKLGYTGKNYDKNFEKHLNEKVTRGLTKMLNERNQREMNHKNAFTSKQHDQATDSVNKKHVNHDKNLTPSQIKRRKQIRRQRHNHGLHR